MFSPIHAATTRVQPPMMYSERKRIFGILISFISVMVFFPALLLRGNKLIEKTKHRRLTPTFQNIGKGISKIRIPVFCLILILMFPAFLGQSHNCYFYGSSEKTVEGSEAWDIEQEFGVTNSAVLLVPRGDSAKEVQMCDALNDLDHITSVTRAFGIGGHRNPCC